MSLNMPAAHVKPPPYLRRAQPWLGTLVEVGVMRQGDACDLVVAQHAVDAAFAAVAQVQRLMSAHDASSDLGRLHQARPGVWVQIHSWTAEVLHLAQAWHARTNGLFDVARGTGQWVCQVEADQAFAMRLEDACRLDLGGMAKGWAVDRALEAALSAGATAAWVNAGGDLRCQGMSLPVTLRDEAHGGVRPWLTLTDGALATSYFGPGARSALHGSLQAPHVSVAAPSCALADLLTKVVAQCGAHGQAGSALSSQSLVQTLAEQHGARIWVHQDLVYAGGPVESSPLVVS
jgi:thiamine biosynthesis lipoprotein